MLFLIAMIFMAYQLKITNKHKLSYYMGNMIAKSIKQSSFNLSKHS